MEMSIKHLKMIKIALESHIDILAKEDKPPIPMEDHQAELRAYADLLEQIEVVLLRQ